MSKTILTIDEYRSLETRAGNMLGHDALMLRAGTAAADFIAERIPAGGRVTLLVGPGNNGGDGYALACVLCKNGFTPTIFRASDGFSKDGLYYYKTAMSLGADEMPMSQAAAFTGFDIVVDCLLGTGFSGELKGEMLEAVEQINMTNAYVISADVNSGINGDTGVCSTAVNSDLTVSIGSFKTGLFLNDAPYYIGSVTNCDIGISLIEDEYKLIDYSLLHMF